MFSEKKNFIWRMQKHESNAQPYVGVSLGGQRRKKQGQF